MLAGDVDGSAWCSGGVLQHHACSPEVAGADRLRRPSERECGVGNRARARRRRVGGITELPYTLLHFYLFFPSFIPSYRRVCWHLRQRLPACRPAFPVSGLHLSRVRQAARDTGIACFRWGDLGCESCGRSLALVLLVRGAIVTRALHVALAVSLVFPFLSRVHSFTVCVCHAGLQQDSSGRWTRPSRGMDGVAGVELRDTQDPPSNATCGPSASRSRNVYP